MESLSLLAVINKYISRNSPDVVKVGKSNVLRSNIAKTEIGKLSEKTVNINNLSQNIKNPFALAKIESLTHVQMRVRQLIKDKYFEKFGSIALQASCGSGKTLAGLYVIRSFQCKTLIISTRNAVIDQWYREIKRLYPELKIQISESKEINNDADIWILTPQYFNFNNRISSDKFNISPSLIIYDEIHTMLSNNSKSHEKEFLNVLKYPFIRCLNKEWKELPYLLALSATYPKDDISAKKIFRIFGEVIKTTSTITETPISLFDLRDRFTERERGKCDVKYRHDVLDDYDCIDYCLSNIQFTRDGKVIKCETSFDKDEKIKLNPIEISKSLKGLIMTYSIDASVWTSLYLHHKLKCNILLIRSHGEKSYYFDKELYQDFDVRRDIQLADLGKLKIGEQLKDFNTRIDEAEIIVSTVQRMKEGFSNERIIWGITTQFPYSELSRVQIAGRIRRSSKIPEVIKAKRLMIVNSSIIPSTLFSGGSFNKYAEVTYSWQFENELFRHENINYISNHCESKIN